MKLATIGLAGVLALTSTFAVAQNGAGSAGGTAASPGATGTTTGSSMGGTTGTTGSATNSYTPPIGQTFTVVSGQGGLSGSFAGLTQLAGLAPGTRFDALYAPTTLTLVVTPAAYGNLGLAGLSESANQTAVGTALDAARPPAGVAMSTSQSAIYAPLYLLPATAIAPMSSWLPCARSQPLNALSCRSVRPGAIRKSTSGSQTSTTSASTATATASTVSPMLARAVAITCSAARNVTAGANKSIPTANALSGDGLAIIRDSSPGRFCVFCVFRGLNL